jgi:hypothetical protein
MFVISMFVTVSSVPVNHEYGDTTVAVYISPEVVIHTCYL